MQSLFFELIHISVGTQKKFSRIPSVKEWAVALERRVVIEGENKKESINPDEAV